MKLAIETDLLRNWLVSMWFPPSRANQSLNFKLGKFIEIPWACFIEEFSVNIERRPIKVRQCPSVER